MMRDLLFIFIAVFIVVLLEGLAQDDLPVSEPIPPVSEFQQELTEERSAHRYYVIDLLKADQTLSYRHTQAMLAQTANAKGVAFYSSRTLGDITASAESVDAERRFVHQYFDHYQPFVTHNIMVPLYTLAQRKAYALDDEIYRGRAEVWQSSREAFIYPKGDCEDHALALADWLIEMGEDARVAVGRANGEGHAWVVLFKDGKEYLLEATRKHRLKRFTMYPLAKLHPEYQPSHMFNREYFWQNIGSRHTTRYSGKYWKKQSRFRYVGARS